MEVSFLHATVPFAKTIRHNQTTTVEPYPHIKNVSSTTHQWDSLKDLYGLIQNQAAKGACILKGLLKRPLTNEPRANAVDPNTLTKWLVFDIDGLQIENAEDFIKLLPNNFQNVSYIEQLSSTAFFQGNGYKAHLFFRIPPTHPNIIRQFIINLNLDHFTSHISLGTGNLCINYPLDISVNQNSTPLYIAPPIFIGLKDPLTTRLRFIEHAHDVVTNQITEYNYAATKQKQQKTLLKLRTNIGLNAKTPKTEIKGSVELLKNVEPMPTPSTREERGFVYLGINPNNPFSYYHPADNASIIYNFRGEPAFLTSKGLPEYWEQVKPKALTPLISHEGSTPLIFREWRKDSYYNGYYHHKTGKLELHETKNITRLQHFAAGNGIEAPEVIPDWIMYFDPTDLSPFDINKPKINTFVPTPYLINCIEHPKVVQEIPPLIHSIITSVTGNDDPCFQFFVNWLAFIFQTRKKTRTAWVFQGIEGTGKGLLFNTILKPLLGPKYCIPKITENLLDPFNGWLEECIILFIDESFIPKNNRSQQLPNLLRNIITEPDYSLRYMRNNPFTAKSYCNLIFATNDVDALNLSATDRRYNVCARQENTFPGYEGIEQDVEKELDSFAHYLYSYKVDALKAHTALKNEYKQLMREARLPNIDLFCNHIHKGDFNLFYDAFNESVGANQGYTLYKSIIETWAKRWKKRGEDNITFIRRDELHAAYNFIMEENLPKTNFARALTRNQLHAKRSRMYDLDQVEEFRNTARIPTVIEVVWKFGLNELEAIG